MFMLGKTITLKLDYNYYKLTIKVGNSRQMDPGCYKWTETV